MFFLNKIFLTEKGLCVLIFAVAQIAQSVEQGIENPRVGGSIPSLGTIKNPYLKAQIAQSVEQGIENPRVGGSIPSLGTTSLKIKHVLRHALTNILSGSNLIRAQLTSV